MKTSLFHAEIAQKAFRILHVLALVMMVVAAIFVYLNLAEVKRITGWSGYQLALAQLAPFGHFVFFALFFRFLSDLFGSIREHKLFVPRHAQTSRRLMWVCLAYACFGLFHLFFLHFFLGNAGGPGSVSGLEAMNPSYLFYCGFMGVMGLVFYFNSEVFARGEILQLEQDLTI